MTWMPAGEPVTVLHGTPVADRYGNTHLDFTDPERIVVASAAVAPRSSSEQGGTRPGVIVGLTVYLPPGTPISAADRVEARGRIWSVEGEPGEWIDPFDGTPAGIEVAVEAVHG